MIRNWKRKAGIAVIATFALLGLTGCPEHSAYQHCEIAREAINDFPGHEGDFVSHYYRDGGTDFCRIGSVDGHFHHAFTDVQSGVITWYNYG